MALRWSPSTSYLTMVGGQLSKAGFVNKTLKEKSLLRHLLPLIHKYETPHVIYTYMFFTIFMQQRLVSVFFISL